jgi:hypothetical protein
VDTYRYPASSKNVDENKISHFDFRDTDILLKDQYHVESNTVLYFYYYLPEEPLDLLDSCLLLLLLLLEYELLAASGPL